MKKPQKKQKIVSRIQQLREEAGFTQAQLAVFVGVTTNTIQNWENGKSGVEQIVKFLKLMEVLDCKDLESLIEYEPVGDDDEVKETHSKNKEMFSLQALRKMREQEMLQP